MRLVNENMAACLSYCCFDGVSEKLKQHDMTMMMMMAA